MDKMTEELMEAASAGRVAHIRSLVASGASVTARDRNGWTALDHACAHVQMGRPNKAAILLVEIGAPMGDRCPACTFGIGKHHII